MTERIHIPRRANAILVQYRRHVRASTKTSVTPLYRFYITFFVNNKSFSCVFSLCPGLSRVGLGLCVVRRKNFSRYLNFRINQPANHPSPAFMVRPEFVTTMLGPLPILDRNIHTLFFFIILKILKPQGT